MHWWTLITIPSKNIEEVASDTNVDMYSAGEVED